MTHVARFPPTHVQNLLGFHRTSTGLNETQKELGLFLPCIGLCHLRGEDAK